MRRRLSQRRLSKTTGILRVGKARAGRRKAPKVTWSRGLLGGMKLGSLRPSLSTAGSDLST
eukprot:6194663-Pleurochrysis_carterae.AAC.2